MGGPVVLPRQHQDLHSIPAAQERGQGLDDAITLFEFDQSHAPPGEIGNEAGREIQVAQFLNHAQAWLRIEEQAEGGAHDRPRAHQRHGDLLPWPDGLARRMPVHPGGEFAFAAQKHHLRRGAAGMEARV